MSKNCFQCGGVIEGDGIEHRGKVFCSDECCEEFEDEFTTNGGPDIGELDDDFDDDDFDDDDLDFEEDEEEDFEDEYAPLDDDDSRYDN